ncbi:MAG: enoyl-CoA hydratase-related protein [Dehalococcoidia bacterium]|nr:enoyl-CoA hydratase-related protein [Dehalococcoidia bacterium]
MTTIERIDTGTEELLAEREGHVLTLTLNRPERLNAISAPMLSAFSRQLIAANKDPEVRVVIITGAGRGFCSGLDLVERGGADARAQEAPPFSLIDLGESPPTALYHMDKPVICALNGAAAGYGMDLALLCDIRIASEHGKLAAVVVKRNIVPESGGTWLLPRLIGYAKAAELFFRGRIVGAEECLELGLVNAVVPSDDLMDTARAWAQEIAENAPAAVQVTKRLMRLGEHETFETTVDHVMMYFRALSKTEDFREGVRAFLEQRPGQFTGR